MTHRGKICGEVAGALLVCLLLGFATAPHSARAAFRWLRHWHSLGQPSSVSTERINSLPKVVLWAWERPEDVRFLSSNNVAVGFLAKTIYLPPSSKTSAQGSAEDILVRPRLQPLRVSPGTPLIPVVRIETPLGLSPSAYQSREGSAPRLTSYSASESERIASEIVELQNLPAVRAIQIDFDATLSERTFYSALLSDVRSKLPDSIPLSITALASWCVGDPWLDSLPPGTIDEAVPMLFRMGPDTTNIAKFLRSGDEFPVVACQDSLGLSTDETLSGDLLNNRFPGVPSSWHEKRIYVFAPRAWTQPAADAVLKEWHP